MAKKELKGIDAKEDLKIIIGNGLINSWVVNFIGKSDECIPFSFSFRFNIYNISFGLRQICMLNTTVAVTKGDDDWYHYEDKFVEIKAKKKIRYDMLSALGDFSTIEGDYKKLNIWSLIPWAAIKFELSSDEKTFYDNEDGKTTVNCMDYYGYSVPEWNAEGTVEIDNKVFNVTGHGWMERTVSRIPDRNSKDIENKIRLNISCDDNTNLSIHSIFNRLSGEERAWIDYIDKEGKTGKIEIDSLLNKAIEYWQSPKSGQNYPISFELEIPELEKRIVTRPMIYNQEAYAKHQNECRYYGGGYTEDGTCFYEMTGLWK